jgi:hypothetical protein
VKYPDDIWKSAEEAFDRAAHGKMFAQDSIAAAILAERKRCAEVARHLNGWGADCGRGGHAEHIAKAIESGQ